MYYYYYYYKARIQQLSKFAAKPRELEPFLSGVLKDGFPFKVFDNAAWLATKV